jgi:hypothetical protein
MAKKHWIYLKRGLSEDPKHRSRMGECVWLFMHIIDRADWETGIAFDWKDREEAADMCMPVDTLRRQRQKLEELDYIRTVQKQHSQNIYIMEWKDPRNYGAEIRNPRNQGSHEQLPSENDEIPQGDNQGLNEGLNQDSNQVQAQDETPTYNSKSKSSSKSKRADAPLKANQIPQIILFKEVTRRYPSTGSQFTVIVSVDKVGDRLGREATAADLAPFFREWCDRGYKPVSVKWLSEWAVPGVIPNGNGYKPANAVPKGVTVAQSWLAKKQAEQAHGE